MFYYEIYSYSTLRLLQLRSLQSCVLLNLTDFTFTCLTTLPRQVTSLLLFQRGSSDVAHGRARQNGHRALPAAVEMRVVKCSPLTPSS